jgi:SAM-dependent methyltransferase
MLAFAQGSQVHGCDVDARAIEWCRANLPFARVTASAARPPLPYADASFDLIYSISVFSHLEERNHLEWLAELRRICAPGGLVIVTTHGRRAAERVLADPPRLQQIGVEAGGLDVLRDAFPPDGYVFFKQVHERLDSGLYGVTFIGPEYVRRAWTPYFELVDYESGGLQDWQDVITLRPVH